MDIQLGKLMKKIEVLEKRVIKLEKETKIKDKIIEKLKSILDNNNIKYDLEEFEEKEKKPIKKRQIILKKDGPKDGKEDSKSGGSSSGNNSKKAEENFFNNNEGKKI